MSKNATNETNKNRVILQNIDFISDAIESNTLFGDSVILV